MRKLATVAVAFILLCAPAHEAVNAGPSKLARLQTTVGNAPVTELLDQIGLQHAEPPITSTAWRITPADSQPGETRPVDRVIELFTGAAAAPVLLCRIQLRY